MLPDHLMQAAEAEAVVLVAKEPQVVLVEAEAVVEVVECR